MPTLQQITCLIELSQSRTKLKEYGARYHDAAVEVFIAVPDEKVPFCVHISTEGYIAPGLAFFVFIDGEYHANRNRRRLRMPGPGVDKKYYEVDTVLRQKEEKIKGGGFIGRDWVFNELKIANADTASPQNLNYIHNVGTIEVVVLRCKPDPPALPRMLKDPNEKPDAPAALSASRHSAAAPPAKPASAKAPSVKAKTATPAGSDAGFGGMFGLFDGANDAPDLSMSPNGANDLTDLSISYDGTKDPPDQAKVNMILNARPSLNLAHPELSSPLNHYFDQYGRGRHRGTSEPTVYTINTEASRSPESLSPLSASEYSQSTEQIQQALYEANKNDAALQHALSRPYPNLLDDAYSPCRSSRDQFSDRLSPRENPQVDGYNGSYPQTHIHQPWDGRGRNDTSGDRYFGVQGDTRTDLREKYRQQGHAVSPVSAPRVEFSPQNEVFTLPFHPREQNMQYYQKFKDPIYLRVDVLDIDPVATNDKGKTFHVTAANLEDTVNHMYRIVTAMRDERDGYETQHDQTPPGRIRDAIQATMIDLADRANLYSRIYEEIRLFKDRIMAGGIMQIPPRDERTQQPLARHEDTKSASQQRREPQPPAVGGWTQTGQGTVGGGQQLNQSWSPQRQIGQPGPGSIAGSQKTEEHFGEANCIQHQAPTPSNCGQSHQQHVSSPGWVKSGGQSQQHDTWNQPQKSQNKDAVGWHAPAPEQSSNNANWNEQSSGQDNAGGDWNSSGDQQPRANQWGGSQASNRSRSKKGTDGGWGTEQQSPGAADAWANDSGQIADAWGFGDNAAKSQSGSQKGVGDGWGDDTKNNTSHRSKQSAYASNRSAGGGWGSSGSQQKGGGNDGWGGDASGQNDSWGNNDGTGGQKAGSNKGWSSNSNAGPQTQTRDFAYAQAKSPQSVAASGSSSSGTPIVKPYFADWQKSGTAQHDSSGQYVRKKPETARQIYEYPAKEMPAVPASKTSNVSHGVQTGKGAKYTHATGRPEYIDSMQKPFAVFSFKYRSKGYLEKLLNRKITMETEPVDEAALKDKLLNLPRHKLVEELMMARGALPGYAAKGSPESLKSAMKKSPPRSEKSASHGWGGGEQKAPSNNGWGGGQKAASNAGWGGEQKTARNAGWGSNGGGGGAAGWDGADKRSSHSQSGGRSQSGNEKKSAKKTDGGEWSSKDAPAAVDNSWGGGDANGWSNAAPAAATGGGWGADAAKWDGPAEHKDSPAIAAYKNAPPVYFEDGKAPSVATGYESSYTPEQKDASTPAPSATSPRELPMDFEDGKEPSVATGYESSYTPERDGIMPASPGSTPWKLRTFGDAGAPPPAGSW